MVTLPVPLKLDQRAGGIVTHQRKVVPCAAVVGIPRDDDLSVGLHRHAFAVAVEDADEVVTLPVPLKLVSSVPLGL